MLGLGWAHPWPHCPVQDLPTRHTCFPDFHPAQNEHLQHPPGNHPAGGGTGGAVCPEAGRHCLPGDEGAPQGSRALGSVGVPPHHQSWPGLLVGTAWDAQSPCPVTSGGEERLRPREPSRAGAGRGWEGFHEAPGGGGTTCPSPVPQMEGYMRAEVASDTLVALSRNHFSLVMYELQHHLKPLDLTDEFVIITLAKLAHGNGRARGTSAPASGPFGPAQGSLLVSASLHFCSCLCPMFSISLLPYLSLAFLFSCPRVFLSCEDSLCVSASHVGLYSSVISSPPNRSLSSLPLRLHSCHLPFSRGGLFVYSQTLLSCSLFFHSTNGY